MDSNGIIPDVIDTKPDTVLEVIYPSGAEVELGKELTPTQVKDEPKVTWNADSNALYTLVMVDPDAPSRADPKLREILHWLVVNIPGNKVAEGQTIAEYIGSGAPEGTGLHRYIFLVFKQSHKSEAHAFIPKTSRQGRVGVNTKDYIAKYNLGAPVAGNYFQAQFDEYVPILHAQFIS